MAILQSSVNIGINWVKLQQDKVWLLGEYKQAVANKYRGIAFLSPTFLSNLHEDSQKEATLANKIVKLYFVS